MGRNKYKITMVLDTSSDLDVEQIIGEAFDEARIVYPVRNLVERITSVKKIK